MLNALLDLILLTSILVGYPLLGMLGISINLENKQVIGEDVRIPFMKTDPSSQISLEGNKVLM